MPPRARKTSTQAPEPAQACPLCFPAGFPPGTYSLGCEHGTWSAAELAPDTDGTPPAASTEPTE